MPAASGPIELTIERPVAGGRMLARADGRVVLVAGAIPGETVRARIERVERGVAFARVEAVLTPSPDRREPFFDAACGGGVYAHVDPARQVALKREVILDGLRRGAGITWEQPLAVAASPERGYRLRARLHVRDGRIGFFKEGTHVLCDAAPSAQLDAATLDVAHRLVDGLGAVFGASSAESLEVSENLDGSERAVHLHPIDRALVGTTHAGVAGRATARRRPHRPVGGDERRRRRDPRRRPEGRRRSGADRPRRAARHPPAPARRVVLPGQPLPRRRADVRPSSTRCRATDRCGISMPASACSPPRCVRPAAIASPRWKAIR